jgi:hypothetical protein
VRCCLPHRTHFFCTAWNGGANAHAADEYVLIDQIPMLARILALTAIDYLGAK